MGYQMFLHETFRTGLVFLSQLKWVQRVVCYDQNLQKHKYLSGISTFLHETFRTGLIFLSRSKWVQIVVCYDWNLQNLNISVGYQCFWTKPSEQGSFFQAGQNESNSGMLWSKLTKHKYLSGISMFLHKSFRTGLIFPNWSKWVQIVVCYNWNLQKHKYLSDISTFLHETFRTGLIFLSWLKWVQIVVCYDRNLQKHKYLSEISTFLHFSTEIFMFL